MGAGRWLRAHGVRGRGRVRLQKKRERVRRARILALLSQIPGRVDFGERTMDMQHWQRSDGRA